MPASSELDRPLAKTLRWLTAHAGFPSRRLAAPAEILLCVAALAEAENTDPQANFGLLRRMPRETAALRSHALRRSHAQFKSDNSSKV